MIVVVDLDGTLCNSGHREHLARAKQWDAFHSQLMNDDPWPDVQRMIKLMDDAGYTVIGLTGRNERYRIATMHWLGMHNISLDDILMRPNDDYTSDHELKPSMLDEWLEAKGMTHADVWVILEDRDRVTEAFRNLGHNVWQVRSPGY